MSREAWEYELGPNTGELSLEEVGGMIRGEPRGVGLMRYQRELALEQRADELQRDRRRRYDAAAGE